MSSHHIVREKQEPALFILSLQNFDPEWLGQLLEWSPTVIATAGVAEQLLMADIHIDWLLTEGPAPAGLPAATLKITSAPDKWLGNALQQLINEGYPAVNLITDDVTPELYLPFILQINIVIYHQQQKIYAVPSGFEKWKTARTTLHLNNPPDDLQCTNLARLNNGSYQVQTDGFVKLIFTADYLFVAEDL